MRRGLEDIFQKASGRIVVATFASNIHRVQQIVTGDCRGSHNMPIMPVRLNSTISWFDGPPVVSCAAYAMHDGHLTEALDAFQLLCRTEGIIPALEPSHAIAAVRKVAPTMGKDEIIVANLCGRGDKDIGTLIQQRPGT